MRTRKDRESSDGNCVQVSVLTPAYNEESNIAACISSVKKQTFKYFEHIIVDDCSTDETVRVARQTVDERAQILTNPKKGKLSAFKHAFSVSEGSFIVLLAADDVLPHDSLERRINCMRGVDPMAEVAVARGHLKTISGDPRFDNMVIPKHRHGNFSGGTIILSRKFAELVFDVPDDLPNEDTWIRLCAEHLDCKVLDSPGVTLGYRIHAGNSSASRGSFDVAADNYSRREMVAELFLKRYEPRLSESSKKHLKAKLALEDARGRGATYSILATTGVSLTDKVRALIFRCKFAYAIRQIFWRQLVGWRK